MNILRSCNVASFALIHDNDNADGSWKGEKEFWAVCVIGFDISVYEVFIPLN